MALSPALRSLAILACVTSPAPLLACPTELGAGLIYTAEDGARTTVTPTDRPSVLRERVVYPEGDGFELVAYFGVYILETFDFDAAGVEVPDSREVATFAAVPELPGPDGTVVGIMAEVVNASDRFQRRHDAVAGPLAEVAFGDCRYQAYPIELRLFDPDRPYINRLLHVPALGVSFFVGFEDQDNVETYTITGIEALTPAAPAN
jgi:hypothetical protein